MSSRIRFEHVSKPAYELVEMLRNGQLSIPPHQRDFSWDEKKQQRFINTVQEGLPTASILVRVTRGSDVGSLEDGRQRLTTLMNYMQADSTLRDKETEGRRFSELPTELQRQMENYPFCITRYSNATDEQAVEIFMRAQFGLRLTTGQLMYALKATSPLVQYANNTLLTSGSGLHDRAALVWGIRNTVVDKNRNTFQIAVIYAISAVYGVTTRKWGEIEDKKFLSKPVSALDLATATDRLTKLIRIYELTEERHPTRGKSILNRQWSLSNFSPYILWSLYNFPNDHERLTVGWVAWLVAYRKDESILDTQLQRDKSSARSWNDQRWRYGYLRVFDPDSLQLPTSSSSSAGGDSDDDYDDESED